jgi:hypothetical protein
VRTDGRIALVTDPYAEPTPVPFEKARRPVFPPIFAAVLVAVVVAGMGLVIGWLWAELAPRVGVIKTANGFIYADAEPEQAVAADGWFAIIGAAAGLVFGVLVWQLRRFRGVVMMVGLAMGSLIGAYLAWWLGYKIGMSEFAHVRDSAAVGARLEAPLNLRMTGLDAGHWWPPKVTGVAAVQALFAVITYTCLAGFSAHANLRGAERPEPEPEPVFDQHWTQFGPGLTGNSDSATGTART